MHRLDEVAAALLAAERSRTPVAPPTETLPQLSIADAYAIQRIGLQLRRAEGAVVVGHKIGLTSLAMQELLGVDQPDFGYLTAAMVSESGCTLSAGDFLAPRAEAEIAFRFARPLAGPDLDVADVLAAVDAVAPAIEVIDSRIADWRLTIADTVADNASSGHVVLGAWQPLGALDLAAVEAELTVAGPGGRHEAVHGRGDAVLGHPATAVAWLARALHEYGGDAIAPGEIVLSGAMARAVVVQAGDSVRATAGALGAVTADFATSRAGSG
jgi:2-keto-4-pentenoate hydratase